MKRSDLFLDAFEESKANLAEACKRTGVTRTQVMRLAQLDLEFGRKMWEIYEGFIDLAISTQFKLGLTGDGKCLNDFLSAHAKHRGYSKADEDGSAYGNIIKPIEGENPEKEFQKQLGMSSTEDIEKALKNIKKIKI